MQISITTFKDLKVWRKAHELTLLIYKVTVAFPSEEKFGLINQMRRTAYSIAANIVEGRKRRSLKDYLHFLNIAEGSLEEIKYFLLLSYDLGYLQEKEFLDLTRRSEEVGKMLYGLRKGLSLS